MRITIARCITIRARAILRVYIYVIGALQAAASRAGEKG